MRSLAGFTAAVFLCALGVLSSASAQASFCASSPEAAAAAVFVAVSTPVSYNVNEGYRVQDVQIDALTKRIWVRVRRCGNDAAPALLVLMQARLGSPVASGLQVHAGAAARIAGGEVTSIPPPPVQVAAAPRVIAVQPGEAIRIIMDGPAIHMEMEGTAVQQAALGERVEVELRRTPNEPPHRMLGMLRAGHRVEVQP